MDVVYDIHYTYNFPRDCVASNVTCRSIDSWSIPALRPAWLFLFGQRQQLNDVHSVSNYFSYNGKCARTLFATHDTFYQALVRLSLACFRPRNDDVLELAQEGLQEPVGAGHCLRALLTHMSRRLHESAELALNGVRAGGTRHRSSIQKVPGGLAKKRCS